MALFAQLLVKGLQSDCLCLCAVRREIEVAPPGSCARGENDTKGNTAGGSMPGFLGDGPWLEILRNAAFGSIL